MTTLTTPTLPCSCGELREHIIAERRTADGARVHFTSHGTFAVDYQVLARRLTRPETYELMSSVSLYDTAELLELLPPRARRRAEIARKDPRHR